ncbi:MAG: 2OG-Fe(II) Oxygenase [Myxococcaceae bacterium]|nr:2OG-Fe(II) Oxygenase [Myxococcaceae bacterium]MEA2749392.1 prolyl 4-hydroxylase [Myxococcales bacterium]
MALLLDVNAPMVWTVPDVLTRDECAALVARIEAAGCVPAPITTGAGFVMRPDIRNNTRVVIDDVALAADLFRRVAAQVPKSVAGWDVVGANERLRCYRYERGQRFAPHYDGAFVRNAGEMSRVTFMLYLNDDFAGGTTDFLELDRRIEPRTGMALFFQHRLLHEGCAVTEGVKYVLRSDLMYRAPSDVVRSRSAFPHGA